ncbi:Gnt-I system high-affinity gluconate transporter [Pseudarcicella hirudinis]|uniref:Gnt-I system high-affinity gluconate transporter n=1 Tax=Pseudarcicella hirudinis TaxID=1079859 RepID=A0A1I5XCQ9_9BACT|nr:gluconate:H+ symporter [Pseudarcicella hirudinis]SFQ29755.1 Gnt-I system high-affinity gluconate transporter [Pseudarcicella hirudinis]
MTLFIVLASIGLLVLLITLGKLNPFLAFLVVSIVAGLSLGIPLSDITKSVQKGIGDMLGSLIIIISLGAMLGKLVAESGAAQKIASVMMKIFGVKYIQWGLVCTGFIIGIPLFYNVGFVLMIPLIFSVVYQYKLPAIYIGLPMLASLSVAHGFLPPHPSPAALVGQFHADMGKTLLYGISIAIPSIIIAGPLFSQTLKKIKANPPEAFLSDNLPEDQLPGGLNSFFTSLLPVFLLAFTTIVSSLFPQNETVKGICHFIGDPAIVMLIAVTVATFTLGSGLGKSIKSVMETYGESIKDIAMCLLIIGGSGALKQVLVDSGVSKEIAGSLQNWNIHPLVLGWLISAFIRVCLGSATVAGLTTAGIIAPMLNDLHVDPNLMVLSVGVGSLMFSHVNDPGFWLFKEYFNISIKDTIRSWSMMETIVSVTGLIGVMILNTFI